MLAITKTETVKSYFLLILVGILVINPGCNKGENDQDSCNGEGTRREIKIAIDSAAPEIDTIQLVTTIDSIVNIEVPEVDKNSPRQDIEKRVITITAEVYKLSKHRDGDWKVKLSDGNDQFVNCESPNMGCEYIINSIFYSEMEAARNWIEDNKNELVGKTVTITGIAFIDVDHHYPRNSAENEIEIHPILDIHF